MQLFPQEPRERLTYLSLPHVLPPENVCGIIVTERDAAQGKELRFDYANREDDGLWSDLVSKIRVVCETVPGGVAVFFPSYQSLEKFTCFLHARGLYSILDKEKRFFAECRGDKNVFGKYAAHVRSHKEGALLLAVIGGSLSEGINFSDELGRCVVIVGMPYANRRDVVLQERMRFADSLRAGGGDELYQNMCMKAVNQTIGRAFRHKGDWASVVFLDCRYAQERIREQITPWINRRCVVEKRSDGMRRVLSEFCGRF